MCQICGKRLRFNEFDCDHIKPIAIDGEMWDMDNLQTLCIECHKNKTKEDMHIIRKYNSPEELKKLLQEVIEDGYA